MTAPQSKNGIGMELKGFFDFEFLLSQLPDRVEKKVMQGAVMAAMREGRKTVRPAIPAHVDEQSPASKIYGTARKNVRVVRLKRVPPNARGARIDTGKAFWMFFYEIGTAHQPARPVFAPAVRRATTAIIEKLRESLGAGIEKEAAKFKGVK